MAWRRNPEREGRKMERKSGASYRRGSRTKRAGIYQELKREN
jgi:hypothetical protein